jgi:hypothetical protein
MLLCCVVLPTGTVAADDGAAIGDAWSDPRNPIVKIFGGERLDLWSLTAVKRPELPTVADTDWVKQDLDRFVLARFENDGIAPPTQADPRTLARRLYAADTATSCGLSERRATKRS